MSLFQLVPTETQHELAELVLPIWAFPAIAAAIFLLLAVITWSYRDVAHRHNDKTSGAAASQDSQH